MLIPSVVYDLAVPVSFTDEKIPLNLKQLSKHKSNLFVFLDHRTNGNSVPNISLTSLPQRLFMEDLLCRTLSKPLLSSLILVIN